MCVFGLFKPDSTEIVLRRVRDFKQLHLLDAVFLVLYFRRTQGWFVNRITKRPFYDPVNSSNPVNVLFHVCFCRTVLESCCQWIQSQVFQRFHFFGARQFSGYAVDTAETDLNCPEPVLFDVLILFPVYGLCLIQPNHSKISLPTL